MSEMKKTFRVDVYCPECGELHQLKGVRGGDGYYDAPSSDVQVDLAKFEIALQCRVCKKRSTLFL